MKTPKTLRSLKDNQSGVASIVIVIIIMTILTLVVIGMTQNASREQRQGLDRQLNSQAFYAAESGVADAIDYLAANPTGQLKKETCDPVDATGRQFPGKRSQVGDDPVIRYSCVLYNRIPATLRYSSIPIGSPTITPIENQNASQNIGSLTFKWHKEEGATNFAGCSSAGDINLPQSWPATCDAGMLRVELIDPDPAFAGNRQALLDNVFVAYLKPSQGGASTIAYRSGASPDQGTIATGGCNATDCEVTISGIDKKKLYLNLRSVYVNNAVTVEGRTMANTVVEFRGAQVEIDSTGRANDVLKRIRVNRDLGGGRFGTEYLPPFVIETTDQICKRLSIRTNDSITNECGN